MQSHQRARRSTCMTSLPSTADELRNDAPMSPPESAVLRQFRSYGVRVGQMLFFNNGAKGLHLSEFTEAFRSLIARGLVVQETHGNAYSLTARGYRAALAASEQRKGKSRMTETGGQGGPQRHLTEVQLKTAQKAAKKAKKPTAKAAAQHER